MKSVSAIFLLFALLNISACAQEKTRASVRPSNSGASRVGETPETCSVRFVKSGVCLDWKWQIEPTRRDKGVLEFKTYQVDESLPQPQMRPHVFAWTPEVVLWMPSMGHGSTPTTTVAIGPGQYQTRDVYFVMGGKWEIRFEVRNTEDPNLPLIDEAVVNIQR